MFFRGRSHAGRTWCSAYPGPGGSIGQGLSRLQDSRARLFLTVAGGTLVFAVECRVARFPIAALAARPAWLHTLPVLWPTHLIPRISAARWRSGHLPQCAADRAAPPAGAAPRDPAQPATIPGSGPAWPRSSKFFRRDRSRLSPLSLKQKLSLSAENTVSPTRGARALPWVKYFFWAKLPVSHLTPADERAALFPPHVKPDAA
jgi:hypothetical protein